MKSPLYIRGSLALLLTALPAAAGVTIAPLATFGGGDGWRAPLEVLAGEPPETNDGAGANYKYLGTLNEERGMAYNPVTDRLVLVHRFNAAPSPSAPQSIRLLDAATGEDKGALALGTDVIIGTFFPINMVAVSEDGVIYVANLQTNVSTGNFRIYRWADEAATPTVFYNDVITGYTGTPRHGDSLDVIGTGDSTTLIAGAGGVPGYSYINVQAGIKVATAVSSFTPTGVNADDLKTGITFGKDGASQIWGKNNATPGRRATFSGAVGTYDGTLPLTAGAEAPMDVITLGGRPYLATVETNNSTTLAPRVRVYDVTVPGAPALAVTATTAAGPFTSNGNRVGSIKWGKVTEGPTETTATLYAMSCNQGIQAFTVTVTAAATPPAISTHPVNRTFFERGVATFTVSATGTPPLTYQWLHDNMEISGATSSTLSFRPVTQSSAGNYTCRVSGPANPPAVSDPATLTVAASVNSTALTEDWVLLPGSRPYLTTGDTQRGLGYNHAKGRLYLASRTPTAGIHVLDATDGAEIGALNMTDVAGGFFAINMAAVAGDGFIYAANLTTSGAGFRIYQWSDDLPETLPGVVYDGNPLGVRIGDSFTVRGSGANTQCAAGANATNQFAIFRPDPDRPGFFQAIPVTVPGAANGAFSLGIAFGQGDTVWGKSNGGGLTLASFSVDFGTNPPTATGTLVATYGATVIPGSGGAIGVDAGAGCLAHIHVGDSDNVRLYRLPSPFPDPPPATLELLDQEFYQTDNTNPNAVGTAVFGGNRLFALNAANGIAAYTVAKPLPPTPDPVITDVKQEAGNVVFKLRGTAGKTYLIEKSTQLTPAASWVPDGTVTQAAVEETVTRAIPAGTPRLYFRAREQ